MSSASQLRADIEASLAGRIPAALTPMPRSVAEVMACGIGEVDEVLCGGLPVGAITEFVGPECSGRTSMALAYMAAVTRAGSVCAWIDVADGLDPEGVAANGVDLERLLWVRCGSSGAVASGVLSEVGAGGLLRVGISKGEARHTGGGSPHPRSEGGDMPQAIGALLQTHGGLYDRQMRREKKMIGTPGMPNRAVAGVAKVREEQANSDRLPPRRGDNLAIAPRCVELQPRRVANVLSGERLVGEGGLQRVGAFAAGKPWAALDKALRATDLLLQGGGFSALVLDMGSTLPEHAWRVPLATWFRFRAACERTRVSLLLLTQHPCARSSAELVVRMEAGSMEAEETVMTGVRYRGETERSRLNEGRGRVIPIRKPPQAERPGTWRSEAAWAQAK